MGVTRMVKKWSKLPHRFKMEKSSAKVMLSAFWGEEGQLLEEYPPQRQMISMAAYCETLGKLCRVIQKSVEENWATGSCFCTIMLALILLHWISAFSYTLIGMFSFTRLFIWPGTKWLSLVSTAKVKISSCITPQCRRNKSSCSQNFANFGGRFLSRWNFKSHWLLQKVQGVSLKIQSKKFES